MNKTACQYVIVRFSPYVETGEFANVGILMVAPDKRYFGFRLEMRRHGRVTRFFDRLDPSRYRGALLAMREEFQRIHDLLRDNDFEGGLSRQLFSEAVRPREGIVRFGEAGFVLADEPEKKLHELFAFYVERNFVTKRYKETVLEEGVRAWLNQNQLGERFRRLSVGDGGYQATFPFVERIDNQPVKVIKPLHLAQDEPSRILDHGGAWLFRLNALKRRNTLPQKALFTVSGPENVRGPRLDAFEDIVEQLAASGVEVADYSDKGRVLAFALA